MLLKSKMVLLDKIFLTLAFTVSLFMIFMLTQKSSMMFILCKL